MSTTAQDLASARRWLARVIRRVDMDHDSRAVIEHTISTLRVLEQREKQADA